MPVAAYTFQWTRAVCQLPDGLHHTVVLPSALGLASARFFASIGIAVAVATASTPSRSRTVRCARERGGRPDPTSLDPACHPVLVSMVRGKGFPRRAPAGSRTRRRQRRKNDGTGGAWTRPGREGIDLGAPVGPCGGSWGTVRRTGPGSGSSDHSSEPSVSAGAFASRRRDAISRAAPPPSTTTAASAISAMPAPVWARVLR